MRKTTAIALAALGIATLLTFGVQAQTEGTEAAASPAAECDASGAILLDGFSAIAPDQSDQEGALSTVEGLNGPGWVPVVQEEPCGDSYPGATQTSYQCSCSGPRLRKLVDQQYCNACGCTWVRVSSTCTWVPCSL